VTYRVFWRMQTVTSWSATAFEISQSFYGACDAVILALDKVEARNDVFIDCGETGRLYSQTELLHLAREWSLR
jgi:hypothetical protein